jgi:glutamate 5-kinase
MAEEGLTERPDKTTSLPELQWLSCVGWPLILKEWAAALDGRTTGGILLTKSNLDLASSREEALRTVYTGLVREGRPIINENDAITHNEITFGDNDILAAILAARMVGHSALFGANIRVVILSDVNGVRKNRDDPSTRIHVINHIRNYEHLAGGVGSANATGGMASKFKAAEIVTEAGMHMYVAHGRTDGVLEDVLSGESRTTGTEFLPKAA